MRGAPRPRALLIARSLRQARDYALTDLRCEERALDRYVTPDGEELEALADRSAGFLARPRGTRVHLVPGWSMRDDWRQVNEAITLGHLVDAAPR